MLPPRGACSATRPPARCTKVAARASYTCTPAPGSQVALASGARYSRATAWLPSKLLDAARKPRTMRTGSAPAGGGSAIRRTKESCWRSPTSWPCWMGP